MHLIERFTRTDPSTLVYEFSVEDPTTLERGRGRRPFRCR